MTEKNSSNFSLSNLLMYLLMGLLVYSLFIGNHKGIKVGTQVKPLVMTNLQSKAKEEVLFTSKKTVLFFWATWCGICVRELAQKAKLTEKLESLGIHARFINTDKGVSSTRLGNFLTYRRIPKTQWRFFLYKNSSAIVRRFKVRSYPTTIVVNKTGKVERVLIGTFRQSSFLRYLKGKS